MTSPGCDMMSVAECPRAAVTAGGVATGNEVPMRPDDTTPTKTCAKCGCALPATADFFNPRSDTGKPRSYCLDCTKAYNRAYFLATRSDPEVRCRRLAYQRAYRARPHVAERERLRSYEYNHRPEVVARRKQAEYKEHLRQVQLAYLADPETIAKRRERDRNRPEVVLRLDWYRAGCRVCGLFVPDAMEAHHVDPSEKDANFNRIRTVAAVAAELEKCIPLCANHHMRMHRLMERMPGVELETLLRSLDDAIAMSGEKLRT